MPTAEQSRAALKIANDRRIAAARERAGLCGKPVSVVTAALVNPSEALASMRLANLFGTRGHHRPGVIPKIGPRALHGAFLDLLNESPKGRQWWHAELRLGELTELERRRLIDALVKRAPASWREGR